MEKLETKYLYQPCYFIIWLPLVNAFFHSQAFGTVLEKMNHWPWIQKHDNKASVPAKCQEKRSSNELNNTISFWLNWIPTFTIADSSFVSRSDIFPCPMAWHACSNSLGLKEAIANSHVIFNAADDTINAGAVKTSSLEPLVTMLPHKAIYIGASRSWKIGASNLFVNTSTHCQAVF